jgi:hypothetical protein
VRLELLELRVDLLTLLVTTEGELDVAADDVDAQLSGV